MRVFVYGTLKRRGTLHHHLRGQRFLGTSHTQTPCRLFKLGWYPGLVQDGDGFSIEGEVWEVDHKTLAVLDEVEGVDAGLYERRPIQLLPPFDKDTVIAYFYCGDVAGCEDCSPVWPVEPLSQA